MLIPRQVDGDHVGVGGSSSLYALLMDSVAELYERLIVETYEWYVAGFGLLHQGTGRGPKPDLFTDLTHLLDVDGECFSKLLDGLSLCETKKHPNTGTSGKSPDGLFHITK